MTKAQAISKLLAWAAAQVGTREGANNWNKYAEDPRLRELYGWNAQNQPWCDLFTDEAFVACFGLETGAAMTYQPIGHGSAACRTSAAFFREHGAFVTVPEPGDVIFFFVGGAINHQGIVLRVSGGTVVTVEGNSADMVAERCYSLTDGSIAGYGRPHWELAERITTAGATGAETDDPEIVKPEAGDSDDNGAGLPPSPPTLRCGAVGAWVAALQGVLAWRRCDLGPCGVDGDFGTATLAAVRQFQSRSGLTVDGVVGPETWAMLTTQKGALT